MAGPEDRGLDPGRRRCHARGDSLLPPLPLRRAPDRGDDASPRRSRSGGDPQAQVLCVRAVARRRHPSGLRRVGSARGH